jgi:alpha-L-fucosidase
MTQPTRFLLIIATAFAILSAASRAADAPPAKLNLPLAPGPFKATMESLSAYKLPDWFRDAKFGIWAHWGPQSVPMNGDWYAKGLYQEDPKVWYSSRALHMERFGHPSKFGYKDIIQLWKAEKWDPDRLMALYKKAGAKYFVSMGVHHDNFDLWDSSKVHRWNAVNFGPKRDVVATWAKAARKEGLRFGVSEHLAYSFTWFQIAHGSDKQGPYAGVPYDGANPEYWDLYHFPAEPDEAGDVFKMSSNQRWQQQWYDRITNLINNYNLDLLYSDCPVPFHNEVGLSMIADLYNTDLKRHGKQQVVYNCKEPSHGAWVQDYEQTIEPTINPDPWQTDTFLSSWFYRTGQSVRPGRWLIHTLVDIVSKNGNMLLNVVQRPDGTIDDAHVAALEQTAAWNAVNGEAIFGTRPWQVYGEGPGKKNKEDADACYSAEDIRFTTKGPVLYATVLGWPGDGKVRIRSLARLSQGSNTIKMITLLGSKSPVTWTQDSEALVVTLPKEQVSEIANVLKITSSDLEAVSQVAPVMADEKGNLLLDAKSAEMHGGGIGLAKSGDTDVIGRWDDARNWASWKVRFPRAGTYELSANIADPKTNTEFEVSVGNEKFTGKNTQGGDWNTYQAIVLGKVKVAQAGDQIVAIRAHDPKAWNPVNVRSLALTKCN